MKRKELVFKLFLVFILSAIIVSCSKDDEPGPITLTQEMLDGVSNKIGSWTGGDFAHGADTNGSGTVRDVFASIASLEGNVPVGTIITKKTWARDADEIKTDELYVSFAMVKREAGYNPGGGDWEWVMMPYDEMNDYSAHPYGKLPAEGADGRGKLEGCISCHAGAAGNDYIFVND